MTLFSPLKDLAGHAIPAALCACVFYVLYYIYWQFTIGASRRRMIREHDAQESYQLPDFDIFFGLENTLRAKRWSKNRELMRKGWERFQRLGTNTFRTNALGTRVIITIEPENLKHVLAVQFKSFPLPATRRTAFSALLGDGIFINNGAAWHHSREMLRPNFARAQVGDMDTYEAHVEHLIASIPRDGATVDLQILFFSLTMDSATELLFGESTNTLGPGAATPGASDFVEAFNRGQEGAFNRIRFRWLYTILPDPDYWKRVQIVQNFADTLVRRAFVRHSQRKASDTRYTFADELCSRTTDHNAVKGELLNILLAGRDTTASLLSNVWFELSRRPDIFAKLQAEIEDLLPQGRGGPRPTLEQIKAAKYLRAVLNESLRLYPVVPGNSREAIADTVLPVGGGRDGKSPMFVPKGTIVGWSLYSMHRRNDLYGPDAEEFRPERWLGDKGLRPGWEYLPFNGGPRICLGQQFALNEASYTTIRLLQEFEAIQSRDARPWQEWLTLTCTGFTGCKVGLTQRI